MTEGPHLPCGCLASEPHASSCPEAKKPADSLGFVDRANVPVDRMRRSIHRSHRGEGNNFVD